MTIPLTFQVTPRVQVTPDSEGKYPITPDLLNDLGRPIVSGSVDENTYLPSVSITVSSEVGNVVSVAVQVQLNGEDADGHYQLFCWLVDSANLSSKVRSTVAPSGTSTLNGQNWLNAAYTHDVTNSDGLATVVITNTGTNDYYLCVAIGGRVYVSDLISFA